MSYGSLPSNRNLDRAFIIECIEVYRSLPALWDIGTKDYRCRKKKDEAYDILVNKYRENYPKATRDDVTKKFNSLRTNFRKELKRIKETKEEPTLWYFDQMYFLEEFRVVNSSTSSMPVVKEEEIEFLYDIVQTENEDPIENKIAQSVQEHSEVILEASESIQEQFDSIQETSKRIQKGRESTQEDRETIQEYPNSIEQCPVLKHERSSFIQENRVTVKSHPASIQKQTVLIPKHHISEQKDASSDKQKPESKQGKAALQTPLIIHGKAGLHQKPTMIQDKPSKTQSLSISKQPIKRPTLIQPLPKKIKKMQNPKSPACDRLARPSDYNKFAKSWDVDSVESEMSSAIKIKTNEKRISCERVISSTEMEKPSESEYEKIAMVWAVELRKMPLEQQVHAKKAINDVLYEGQLGNLYRNCVQINPPGF